MKTVGKVLKEARVRKKYSLAKLEKETKIKKDFLEAIEKEGWDSLPDFPVVTGFVKRIAKTLGIAETRAVALLRRDYPPKSLSINPKPDVSSKFSWSPKLTFLVGIGLIFLVILSYLGVQYLRFVSPPSLTVHEPKDGEIVETKNLQVLGKTDTDATIKINNQPVLVDQDGEFAAEIEIFEMTEELEIVAVSRSGRQTVIHRKIQPELK